MATHRKRMAGDALLYLRPEQVTMRGRRVLALTFINLSTGETEFFSFKSAIKLAKDNGCTKAKTLNDIFIFFTRRREYIVK